MVFFPLHVQEILNLTPVWANSGNNVYSKLEFGAHPFILVKCEDPKASIMVHSIYDVDFLCQSHAVVISITCLSFFKTPVDSVTFQTGRGQEGNDHHWKHLPKKSLTLDFD
jgi:hypothetical protein